MGAKGYTNGLPCNSLHSNSSVIAQGTRANTMSNNNTHPSAEATNGIYEVKKDVVVTNGLRNTSLYKVVNHSGSLTTSIHCDTGNAERAYFFSCCFFVREFLGLSNAYPLLFQRISGVRVSRAQRYPHCISLPSDQQLP